MSIYRDLGVSADSLGPAGLTEIEDLNPAVPSRSPAARFRQSGPAAVRSGRLPRCPGRSHRRPGKRPSSASRRSEPRSSPNARPSPRLSAPAAATSPARTQRSPSMRQVTVLQGQMEAELAAARRLRSTCSSPAWDPSSAPGWPATTRTGMSGKARKNYAVTFPGISDGPLRACVTAGARMPAMGVYWSGAHRDGSPMTEDSCRRIGCDGDRRLLLPIPASREFST